MSSLSAQAIAKREANPEAYGIHVPAHLDVRAIRTKLKMSLHSRLASARSRRSQANSIFTFQTVDYFTARAARTDIQKALKVLKRAGVRKPLRNGHFDPFAPLGKR